MDELESKEKILLNSLLNYFQKKENRDIFISIVNETSTISLRILDWFVTNYSKENSSKIINSTICNGLDIYNSYKSQLKAYNKKLFDPFCRQHTTKNKFSYYYEDDKYITTTTGQLNFFKWAIENKIINYVREHCQDIKKDLKAKQKKTSTVSSSISSQSPLSTTINSSDIKTITNYIICFD
jgi:hypothetical protein